VTCSSPPGRISSSWFSSIFYGIYLRGITGCFDVWTLQKRPIKLTTTLTISRSVTVWMLRVPRDQCLASSMVLLGGGGTLKRRGLGGGPWVIGSTPLEGIVGPQTLLSPSLPGHEVSGFAWPCASAMVCHHRPQSKGPNHPTNQPATQPSKPGAKNNPFIFID
jgi:hypothetical protein